jgi:hypothetical protein
MIDARQPRLCAAKINTGTCTAAKISTMSDTIGPSFIKSCRPSSPPTRRTSASPDAMPEKNSASSTHRTVAMMPHGFGGTASMLSMVIKGGSALRNPSCEYAI